MEFDLDSIASLGPAQDCAMRSSSGRSQRFTRELPRAPVVVPRSRVQSVGDGDEPVFPPLLSHSVSSRRSSVVKSDTRSENGHEGRASGGVYSRHPMVVNHATVKMSDAISRGNDEESRLRYYPPHETSQADGVSPFDSVSVVGRPLAKSQPEFMSSQIDSNAKKHGSDLARSLLLSSDKASPSTKRRVSVSREPYEQRILARPDTVASRGSIIVADSSAPQCKMADGSAFPRAIRGNSTAVHTPVSTAGSASTARASSVSRAFTQTDYSVASKASRSSKIVIPRDVLNDIAHTEIADDINLRTVSGHNIIVMRDGATFEVVDEQGNIVDPLYYDSLDQRRSLGLPPVTARDIHDTLKRSSNGRYGVTKTDGIYTVAIVPDGSAKGKRIVEVKDSKKWKRMFRPV